DVDTLLEFVSDTRDHINALNLEKTVPVGTGDAGREITARLAEGCDFIMANVHPFFGGGLAGGRPSEAPQVPSKAAGGRASTARRRIYPTNTLIPSQACLSTT